MNKGQACGISGGCGLSPADKKFDEPASTNAYTVLISRGGQRSWSQSKNRYQNQKPE
jgi:hypothetical protein